VLLFSGSAASQQTLAHAKDLYASAAYDEALAILNLADIPTDVVEVDQYRALCLLALGRGDDASQVIQRIVEKNPSFEPLAMQVSPRIQEVFRTVQRRVLPSLVRQAYADGKAAFESGNLERAKASFERVVANLNALDAMGSNELADLRILSNGFLDLVGTISKVPARPEPSPPARASQPAVAAPSSTITPSSTIHAAGEADVRPPVPISQVMPPWRPTKQETQTYEGVLVVLIDEKGAVTDVNVLGTLRPSYDALLRRAASGWRFQPAMMNGVPVKYRKVVAIRLTAENE